MPITEIDDNGTMTVPKELGLKNTKALVIPAGSYFITIPIPNVKAGGWLNTNKSRKELKAEAERLARQDAINRRKRQQK